MGIANKEPAAEFGAWLSIGVYMVLAALKLAAGYFSDSAALMADGLNNATDIVASVAVLIGLRIARKPADSDHKYGHSRAETVASLVASFIMLLVGFQVLIDAVLKLSRGDVQSPDLLAAIVAAGAAGVMYVVYRYNSRLAARTNSHALRAVAADNRSDALVSAGTVVGILASVWGLPWLDAATATVVAALIVKTGWHIFREASHMLTDGFDVDELEQIKRTVADMSGVEKVRDIKGRNHGNRVFIDLTIAVHQEMSVYVSHTITENIERELKTKHRIHHVLVHIEPY